MKNIIAVLILSLVLIGCKKDKSTSLLPSQLLSPISNEICFSGQKVSETQNQVTFLWSDPGDYRNYILNVKNLENGTVTSYETTERYYDVILKRGVPYSWYIVSKNGLAETKSETWKFYNAGNGSTGNAPLPAKMIAPALGQKITMPENGKVNLVWEGKDPDNDIAEYDIYFGTNADPDLYKISHKETSIAINVEKDKIYYWRIITKDYQQNASYSTIYIFSVNR